VVGGRLTSAEFADFVALGNALPGPIAPQVSATSGYKLAGVPGAVAGLRGTVLPTTLLMLLMVAFFFRAKDSAAHPRRPPAPPETPSNFHNRDAAFC
jgi:chromate transport protein ChrA